MSSISCQNQPSHHILQSLAPENQNRVHFWAYNITASELQETRSYRKSKLFNYYCPLRLPNCSGENGNDKS
jgi:hypothetical protein